MGIKSLIKKVPLVRALAVVGQQCFFSCLTMISPELNTRARYYQAKHKRLNLKKPSTLSEKLLWLKLRKYINDPLVCKCADKYQVREYIKECGFEDILVKLHGVYHRTEDIDWDSLPNAFVLKWNFGAGFNVICPNKSELKRQETVKQLRKWGKTKYWLTHSEMQYKEIPKVIICEEFLADETERVIPDYKVYCFHGKPQAIFVMHDRGAEIKSEFYDCQWNRLKNSGKYKEPDKPTKRPLTLSRMLEAAETLSAPFPFVRCDFYEVNGKLYFGEMTFTPAGGLYTSETEINGRSMADLIHIEQQEASK